MNKKQYIAPILIEHKPKCDIFLSSCQVSQTAPYSGAGQQNESLSDMNITVNSVDYDNGGLSGEAGANGRGGFGTDAGPWESLW